jgi:hypothetical protein
MWRRMSALNPRLDNLPLGVSARHPDLRMCHSIVLVRRHVSLGCGCSSAGRDI